MNLWFCLSAPIAVSTEVLTKEVNYARKIYKIHSNTNWVYPTVHIYVYTRFSSEPCEYKKKPVKLLESLNIPWSSLTPVAHYFCDGCPPTDPNHEDPIKINTNDQLKY